MVETTFASSLCMSVLITNFRSMTTCSKMHDYPS